MRATIERLAGVLFVAGHDDGDRETVEHAGAGERLQRRDDDDVTAFHVDDAGPARGRRRQALEALERAVGFEHGVEVADEQHARPLAGALGHQVARPIERRAVDPARGEAERAQFRAEDVADLPHAREVHRPAVDVDDAFQQRERGVVVGVHGGGDC